MENEFKRILTLLDKLNDNAPKKIISSSELQEEYNNIKDLDWLNKTTMQHLNLLKQAYSSSIDDIMGQICYLNVKLNTYIWHIESMKDITEKIYLERFKK